MIDNDNDVASGVLTLNVTYGAGAGGGAMVMASTQAMSGGGSMVTGSESTTILGTSGHDNLVGTTADETLIGGAGNDTLTGGLGSDVFQWQLGDQGTATTPAKDVVTDFNIGAVADGGDVLNLRDLLVGEAHSGTGAGNLASFLHFDYDSATNTTTVSVRSHAAGVDQVIALQGVNLVGTFTSDQAIIQDLLTKGKLITD